MKLKNKTNESHIISSNKKNPLPQKTFNQYSLFKCKSCILRFKRSLHLHVKVQKHLIEQPQCLFSIKSIRLNLNYHFQNTIP